jgi:phosphoglycolate phosphatase-like HAD superfamily hydrolase
MKLAAAAPGIAEVLQRAKILVFDFDGTLVDSNPIKRRAFAHCFSTCSDHLEEILAYCWGSHHVPRGDKFRYVYEHILERPYTEAVASALEERFDALTTRQIIDAPEIRGATRFLQVVSRRREAAVLSSTPHQTLLRILEQRGWVGSFKAIQGAPVDKAHWLRTLRQRHGLRPQELVYLGDCREDHAAAEQAGCVFLAVGEGWTGSPFRIPDFTSLVSNETA